MPIDLKNAVNVSQIRHAAQMIQGNVTSQSQVKTRSESLVWRVSPQTTIRQLCFRKLWQDVRTNFSAVLQPGLDPCGPYLGANINSLLRYLSRLKCPGATAHELNPSNIDNSTLDKSNGDSACGTTFSASAWLLPSTGRMSSDWYLTGNVSAT